MQDHEDNADGIVIPIFPLRTVLFPGGPLQLRLFETRYLDMVSRCLRDDTPFGVCLIRQGSEVGQAADPWPVGTLARIVDWDRRNDGLLGITVVGGDRFRIHRTWVNPDHLLMGRVEVVPFRPDPPRAPTQPPVVHDLLDRVFQLRGAGYEHLAPDWSSTNWLSCRLAEILPLDLEFKQHLLEIDSPGERLRALAPMVPALVPE